jgi:hypothetical protein
LLLLLLLLLLVILTLERSEGEESPHFVFALAVA